MMKLGWTLKPIVPEFAYETEVRREHWNYADAPIACKIQVYYFTNLYLIGGGVDSAASQQDEQTYFSDHSRSGDLSWLYISPVLTAKQQWRCSTI